MSYSRIETQHPFGRENEFSLKLLNKYFFNNLYLGQWEAAKASFRALNAQVSLIPGFKPDELLELVVKKPANVCIGSASIQSPLHLEWLCLQEFKNVKDKQKISLLAKDIEFHLLLLEIYKVYGALTVYVPIFKQLSNYCHHGRVQNVSPLDETAFSNHMMQFLESLVVNHPTLAVRLLKALSDSDLSANFSVCALRLQCLQLCWTKLCNDDATTSQENLARAFLTLLANFDLLSSGIASEIQDEIRTLFSSVMHVLGLKSFQNLSKDALYSSAFSRDSSRLLSCLNAAEIECLALGSDMANSGASSSQPFAADSNLLEHIYAVLSDDNRALSWKGVFTTCFQEQKHCLDIFLEMMSYLIKSERYAELEKLFSFPELRSLVPFCVMFFWDQAKDLKAAKALLHLSACVQDAPDLPLSNKLTNLVRDLSSRVQLVESCASFFGYSSNEILTAPKRDYVLFASGLSPLAMLHHLTRISTLQEDSVFQFLDNHQVLHSEITSQVADAFVTDSDLYSAFCVFQTMMSVLLEECDVDITSNALKQVRTFLANISHQNLRLEMIENLFSLMLLRPEDADDVMSVEDPDDAPINQKTAARPTVIAVPSKGEHTDSSTAVNHPPADAEEKLVEVQVEMEQPPRCWLASRAVESDARHPDKYSTFEQSISLQRQIPCQRFLADKSVFAILCLIQECLDDFDRSIEQGLATHNVDDEGHVPVSLKLDGASAALYARLSRLRTYVSEALWRCSLLRQLNKELAIKQSPFEQSVAYMIGSPETLFVLCMKYGLVHKAEEVVEHFSASQTPMKAELLVAKKYPVVLRELHNQSSNQLSAQTTQDTPNATDLDSVAKAATAGVQAVSLTTQTDELLCLCSSCSSADSGIGALLLCDLACVGSASWRAAETLLAAAVQRLADLSVLLSRSHAANSRELLWISTIIAFVRNLQQLVSNVATNAIAGSVLPSVEGLFLLFRSSLPTLEAASLTAWSNAEVSLKETFHELSSSLASRQASSSGRHGSDYSSKTNTNNGVLQAYGHLLAALKHYQHVEFNVCNEKKSPVRNQVAANYAYLQALHNHLRQLECIVTDVPVDQGTDDKESFLILKESPNNLIARCLVPRKQKLIALESQISSVYMELVSVLIQKCCPHIPLYLPPSPLQNGNKEHSASIVLNEYSLERSSTRPDLLVYGALVRLLTRLKQSCGNGGKDETFSLLQLCDFAAVSANKTFLYSLAEPIAKCDTSLLTSRDQMLSFYGNLVTMLTLHSVLWHCEHTSEPSELQINGRNTSTCGSHWDHLPRSAVESILWERRFSYWIGNLGCLNLYDMKATILRQGLSKPADLSWLPVTIDNLTKGDVWYRNAPLPAEPRLLFVLPRLFCSFGPPIQVLSAEFVQRQLQLAENEFLSHSVEIDVSKNEVVLPDLLAAYCTDFVPGVDGNCLGTYDGCEPLLKYIQSAVTGDFADDIAALRTRNAGTSIPSPAKWLKAKVPEFGVTVRKSVKLFQCCLSWPVWSRKQKSSDTCLIRPRSGSLSEETLSSSCSNLAGVHTMHDVFESDLTDTLTEYLKEKCAVVEKLLQVVVPRKGVDLVPYGSKTVDADSVHDLFVADVTESLKTQASVQSLPNGDLPEAEWQEFISIYRHLLSDPLRRITESSRLKVRSFCNVLDAQESVVHSLLFDRNFLIAKLLPFHDARYEAMLYRVICKLIKRQLWHGAVLLVNSPHFTVLMRKNQMWASVRDFVLVCVVHLADGDEAQKIELLSQLSSVDVKVRAIVSCLPQLSAGSAVRLLKKASSDTIRSAELRALLGEHLTRMNLLNDITDIARRVNIRRLLDMPVEGEVSEEQWQELVERLGSWPGVETATADMPQRVLCILVSSQRFEVAHKWISVFHLTEEFCLTVFKYHVTHLLEKESHDKLSAYQLLEEAQQQHGSAFAVSLCESLLERQRDVLFVIDFMLRQLRDSLDHNRQVELHIQRIGYTALLQLPDIVHNQYFHLVVAPVLLVEQLLMNCKMEWVGRVVNTVRQMTEAAADPQLTEAIGVARLDGLLVHYAKRALECTVNLSHGTPGSRSRRDSHTSVMSPLPAKKTPTMSRASSSVMSVPSSQMSRSASVETLHTLTDAADKVMQTPTTIYSQSLVSSHTLATLPIKPPVLSLPPTSRDQWVPDSAATICMVCEKQRFTMFNRRHHCRQCGRVVCAACSTNTANISGQMARVCDTCSDMIQGKSTASVGSQPETDIKFTIGSVQSPLSAQSGDATPVGTPPQSLLPLFQYKLTCDDAGNDFVRANFYYDEAPSATLSLSVLQWHGDLGACGNVLLELCDIVSEYFHAETRDVDRSLVLSMLRLLLFHAKMKFAKALDQDRLELCDVYMARVDLLDLLVSNNCTHIPSVQQLMRPDSLRPLRDRLVEEERWQLAIEMSTKCGLDTGTVWAAWGLALLRSGNWQSARDKLSRILKPIKDRNQATPPKLLNEILQCIEKSPYTAGMDSEFSVDAILNHTLTAKDLLMPPPIRSFVSDDPSTEPYMLECKYYLQQYATDSVTVGWYQRHGCLRDALKYILSQGCTTDVYVDVLLLPSLHCGEFAMLKSEMKQLDPSLSKWRAYLMAACRSLNKSRHYYALYDVQRFMEDHLRAALMCVQRFYESNARSYTELKQRQGHLVAARAHTVTYVEQQLWKDADAQAGDSQRQPAASLQSSRLLWSLTEANKYIKTIDLQIQVADFVVGRHELFVSMLEQWNESRGKSSISSPSRLPVVPTLFASQDVRTDLCCLILLIGAQPIEGMALVQQILQEFSLPAERMCDLIGKFLVDQKKYVSLKLQLECIRSQSLLSSDQYDSLVTDCVKSSAGQASESAELEALIKSMYLDTNKANAYVLCGKLKSAYLVAVKGERVDDVRKIQAAAEAAGQVSVKAICDKWLQQHGHPHK